MSARDKSDPATGKGIRGILGWMGGASKTGPEKSAPAAKPGPPPVKKAPPAQEVIRARKGLHTEIRRALDPAADGAGPVSAPPPPPATAPRPVESAGKIPMPSAMRSALRKKGSEPRPPAARADKPAAEAAARSRSNVTRRPPRDYPIV